MGERNISRLRELIASLKPMHDKIVEFANIYDNYLFAKEENSVEIDASFESLMNMERSTGITESDLNEVFCNLIRYSNYLDPNLKKIEAQKRIKKKLDS